LDFNVRRDAANLFRALRGSCIGACRCLGQDNDNGGYRSNCNQQESSPFHNGSSLKYSVIRNSSKFAKQSILNQGSSSRLAQRSKRRADLLREKFGLLPRREMSAFVE